MKRSLTRSTTPPENSWSKPRFGAPSSTVRARQKERKYLKQFKDRHGRLPKYNDRIPSPP